ncbi:MAG: GWxTD domain-containing protein [Acidobacteria bacterium]|nr:GWxTD domain-containing protein [Acidobacteriota bacterium]
MRFIHRFVLRVFWVVLLATGLCLAVPQDQDRRKNVEEESLREHYKKWLEEDVEYLITPEEEKVFRRLTTDEERDQFIEQFWRRRDPDPKTPFNEYKQEHYRRITYANEHFSSGIPGWKTDRGMVYIKFGPPDHIEDYTYGDAYDRPWWEGGGKTKVYPTQFWYYRFIEGIGQDVELEFVDRYQGNLHKLEANPNIKDLLLTVDWQGKTISEQMGQSYTIDRVVNRQDAGQRKDGYFSQREKDRPFAKYELIADVSRAPEIQFKDLKTIVTANVKYDLFPFDVRADFIKISETQILVPITLQVNNKEVTFEDKEFGYCRGSINFYGMVTTISNRYVKEFEDQIVRDVKKEELEKAKQEISRYQKFLLLPSGLYKLSVVVKDAVSGRVGVLDLRLNVPSYEREELNTSSLILASSVQKVADPENDLGQFVLGDVKVVPDFDRRYRIDDPLWIYMQVYNMTIDSNLLEPRMEVEYIVERDGEPFYRYQDLKGSTFRFMSGDRLVITGRLPLQRFLEGAYTLRILVRDTLSGRTVEQAGQFEVIS